MFDEFKLLQLTIQPILENAVKHGVMEKLHGGLIILHTYCKDNCAVISISDDGVGFNPASIDGEGVGLKNVRFRMECIGGSMQVESKPGVGTAVILKISLKKEGILWKQYM